MPPVQYRYATVQGRRLFYREAGPAGAPAVVLLHGFPASSFMFRDLIPQLAGRYHVIAPDHLGFGLSDAPPTDEVATIAIERRFGAFLIDTFEKNGSTLLDWMPIATIADLTRRCQSAGVPVALAGSLGLGMSGCRAAASLGGYRSRRTLPRHRAGRSTKAASSRRTPRSSVRVRHPAFHYRFPMRGRRVSAARRTKARWSAADQASSPASTPSTLQNIQTAVENIPPS